VKNLWIFDAHFILGLAGILLYKLWSDMPLSSPTNALILVIGSALGMVYIVGRSLLMTLATRIE